MATERTSRRAFLKAGLAGGAAALGGTAIAGPQSGNPANQPPNVPDWTRSLGDGVAVRPYGKPSKHEAHVIRRDVECVALFWHRTARSGNWINRITCGR